MDFKTKYPIPYVTDDYQAGFKNREVVLTPTLTYSDRFFCCINCGTPTPYRFSLSEDYPGVPMCSEECEAAFNAPIKEDDAPMPIEQAG